MPFGDPLIEKPAGTIRIVGSTLGPRGLKPNTVGGPQLVKDFLRDTKADIYGAYEVGAHWDKLPYHFHPAEIFRTETNLKISTSFNQYDTGMYDDRYSQYGGTMLMAMDAAGPRMTTKGKDSTGLGRWSWMLFHGKEGIRTRIISAYCPVYSQEKRLSTVYSQQGRWLRRFRKTNECPRKVFIEDLSTFVGACRSRHERVVLIIDANDDVRTSQLSQSLATHELREGITSHHSELTPPATHRRGSRPIDGIYLSPELHPLRAGFMGICSIGDHRPSYVDLSWENLLGEDVLQIPRPPARRLSTNIPSSVKKYNRLLEAFLGRYNIPARLEALEEEIGDQTSLTPAQQQTLNSLDCQISEGMRHAEKHCRKLAMGSLDFSPALMKAWDTKRLWKLVWERKQGLRRKRQAIRRLAKKLSIPSPLQSTAQQAKEKYMEAASAWVSMKPVAGVTRREFLKDRKDDPTISEEQRKRAGQALRTEDSRKASRHLKRIQGKLEGGAIASVEVDQDDGPPVKLDAPDQVIQAIMNMVQHRYHLIDGSPFMDPALLDELGLLGDSPAARQILEGTYQPSATVDDYTREIIGLLTPKGDSPPVDLSISVEDFVWYWTRARERTSSSVSGRHFGHYKAATKNPTLASVHAKMCQIAYSKGHSLPRWKTGLTVMLEKEAGNINVEKLRAILLLEADFNCINKLYFGHRMMRRGEQDGLLQEECFGSVRHRHPHLLALTRKCLIDYSRLTLTTLAVASVDAAQCYDRIQHTMASLACQCWGIPTPALATLLKTVQMMKIYLRTAHGDTEDHIPNDGEVPFQGILQGNGAGPAIWLVISTFLVLLLRHRNHVSSVISPLTKTMATLVGLLFVDDTDLITLAAAGETDQQVIHKLQQAVDTWQGGLNTTGGALKRKKCTWSILSSSSSSGATSSRTSTTLPGAITIREGQDRVPIQRKEPKDPVKAVGFTQSLDGKMTGQFKAFKEKADVWAENITNGTLDRRLAWQGLRSTIWPSLKFPLSVCTFSWNQGDRLMGTLYRALLPALGANRKFPKLWRHAPPELMGLDLPHPRVEQGIEQMKTLLTMGSSKSLPATTLTATLEAAQLMVGSEDTFLLQDLELWSGLLPHNTLAYSMWEFIQEAGIYVEFEKPLAPKPQRENDAHLMNLFATLPGMTRQRLESLNRCRIATKTMFLSDITAGDGITLIHKYRNPSRRQPALRESCWNWPPIKATANDWELWRQTLGTLFPYNRLPPTSQLGPWITKPHLHSPWWFDPASHLVWKEHSPTEWTSYRTSPTRGRTHYYKVWQYHQPKPTGTLRRATVTPGPRINSIILTGHAEQETLDPTPTTVEELLPSLGEDGWPLKTAWFPDEERLVQAIQNGTARGVSDGSYKPKANPSLAAAAWIILDEAGSTHVGGVVRVTGMQNETNAYRAELQGLHAMVMAVWTLCRAHNVTTGSITLGLDNERAYFKCLDQHLDPPQNMKHVDLIRAIRRIMDDVPIQIHLEHVRGHQDEKADRPLTFMEHLNVAADAMAKDHLAHLTYLANRGKLLEGPSNLFMEGTRLYINEAKVTSDPAEATRFAIFAPQMMHHLHNKEKLPMTAFHLVDFDATKKAMSNSPALFRLWVAKHASGQCAVGKWMHRWTYWEEDNCPLCGAPQETARHVPRCPSVCSRTAHQEGKDLFQKKLEALQTAPAIQQCLLQGLSSPSSSFRTHATQDLLPIAEEQDHIGWDATMEGRISKSWAVIQSEHYRSISSRRTAENWAAGVVEGLWEWTHHIWNRRCKAIKTTERLDALHTATTQLNDTITAFYQDNSPEDLLARDRYLLTEKTLDQRLSTPAYEKEVWIQAMTWACELRDEAASNENTQMRSTMAGWLAQGT